MSDENNPPKHVVISNELITASVNLQAQSLSLLKGLKDILNDHFVREYRATHPNPLNRCGSKSFSQTDEDGITLEIIRRLDIKKGVFAEFGVGNGLENNTLVLAAVGWRGFWVGGEQLAFNYQPSDRFLFLPSWITMENIADLAKLGLKKFGVEQPDVISLDLDGNDLYFTEKLLSSNIFPKLFIVEYNAQFVPPTRFAIDYDPNHRYMGDNYFGAALQNFCDVFEAHGFRLVCCNAHTGANAFFVHRSFDHLFSDVPARMEELFVPPRYHLYFSYGHAQSTRVIESILR